MMADKRDVEIKAKHKGMFLVPSENTDPTLPGTSTYWIVNETTDLPVIVDPVELAQISEMLDDLPDKAAGGTHPDPDYGDGSEA